MEDDHHRGTASFERSKIDSSALTGGSGDGGYLYFPSALNDNTKWTDVKHGVYLSHLESSFVEELHRSILKPKGQNQKDKSTCEMEPFDVHYTPRQQFSGVHYRDWQTVNFRGGNSMFRASTDSNGTAINQEGSGQNFVNEDNNHNKTKARSRLRRKSLERTV